MYEGILKFNDKEAEMIIERYKGELDKALQRGMEISGAVGSSGVAEELKSIADENITTVTSFGYPGERVTAQALENIVNLYNSKLNKARLFIIEYIETVDLEQFDEEDRARIEKYISKKEAEQEQFVTDVKSEIWGNTSDILAKLDAEDRREEQRRKEEEEREKRRQERERKREEREALEKEYERTRANLMRQVNRRKKAGIDLSGMIPDKPQKITRGSVNRLNQIIEKIQDEYRYLSGRGYRGQPR